MEFKQTVKKYGSSYVLTVPADFVNFGLIKEGEELTVKKNPGSKMEQDAESKILSQDHQFMRLRFAET